MNEELLALIKWGLPPIAMAAATVTTILWRRLVAVEDRYVDLIREYNEVLRDLHGSLGTLVISLRTRQNGLDNKSDRD
jgi:hypothetical protein